MLLSTLAVSLGMTSLAHADVTGGQITAGAGRISQAGNTTTIEQSSQNLSLNWQSFNVAANQTVDFVQPGASSIAVNRILGNSGSEIFGQLNANGQVWLINPNGVLFGRGAQVSVGGLVASTLDVSDSALTSSTRSFSGSGKGSVVNQGNINAATGGYVALLGNHVSNQGVVSAQLGTVALGAGSAETLTFAGNQLVHLQVDQSTLNNLAENRQLIQANGGQVIMTAGAKDAVLASVVNNTGIVRAQTVENRNGTITLLGGMEAGTVNVGGTLDASAPNGGDGGFIETSAAHFSLASDVAINASAGHGRAGMWLVDPVDLTIDAPAAATIAATLNGGTSVTETTTATTATGPGTQTTGAGDINVNAAVMWSNAAASYTLNAFHAINVNAPVSGAGGVSMFAAGGNLTIGAGGSVAGATGVTLGTTGSFVNNAGAAAVAASSGRWLIYSASPTLNTPGGLTPDFIQYAAPFQAVTAQATGDGFLYSLAPTINITGLTGTVSKVYDGTTTAALTTSNINSTGLVNGDVIASATGAYATPDAGTGIFVTSPGSASALKVTSATGGIPVYGYALAKPTVQASIGTITPAVVTVSIINNPTKTYNGTTSAILTQSNYQLNGFVAGQGATVNLVKSVAYGSAEAGPQTVTATTEASSYTPLAGTNLANYILPTTGTGPGTILPAPLRAVGLSANNKVYDGTTAASVNTAGATVFGLIAPDVGLVSLNTAGYLANFATANVGNSIPISISGVTLSGAKANDYVLVAPSYLAADITPKALTITGIIANNKIYDATTADTLNVSGATLAGLVPVDVGNVGLSTSGTTGAFLQSDVGNNLPVTATGFSLTGAAASNYSVSAPVGLTANITPALLTVTFLGDPTKVYDGTNAVTLGPSNYTISGFVGGQGATIGQTSATYATKNAGTGIPISGSLAPSDFVPTAGTSLSNYTFSGTFSGDGTITPAPLVSSIVGNPTKVFDGNNTAFLSQSNYAVSGTISGESIALSSPPATGTYASSNAGIWLVTAMVPASAYVAGPNTLLSNYILPTTYTGFGTITRASMGVSINAAIAGNPSKVYDGNTIATLSPSDFVLSGFVDGDGAFVNQTIMGQYATKNVGSQPVSATLLQADFTGTGSTNLNNYTFPVMAFGTGTITPAILTALIINNPTKVYNGTNTASPKSSNFQINGFVTGEGATINPTTTFTYASANAGSWTIEGSLAPSNYVANSGTLLSNYTLDFTAQGPGTITKAPLFVTGVYATNKVYDTTANDTLNIAAAGLSGLVASDDGAVTLGTSSTGLFSQSNVGNGLAVTASGFSISGAAAANYNLQPIAGLAANITPAPLTILGVTANNKNYDATNVATLSDTGATLVGVLGSDQVSLSSTAATGQFSQVNVGSNLPVTVGGFSLTGSALGNYSLSQPGGLTASILRAPLTATIISNPTKPYDTTDAVSLHAADYQLTGFVAGQGATIPQAASSNYLSPNVGTHIGLTSTLVTSDFLANAGTDLSNYLLPTTATGLQGTITARVIDLLGARVYDATANADAGLFTSGGFIQGINGQTLTLTGVGVLNSKNVGQEGFASVGTLTLGNGGGGGMASNYTLVGGTDSVAISAATLTVNNTTANSKVYDGNTVAQLNGATLSGVFAGDDVSLGSDTTGTFNNKNVGNGKAVTTSMTLSGGDIGNYFLVQPTGLTANITPLAIIVGATGQNKTYDGTTAANVLLNSPSVIAGDSVNFTAGSSTFAQKDVGNNIAIAVSGITDSGADAGNYTFNTTATTAANITPALITLNGTRVYDTTTNANASLFAPGGTIAGVNGETLGLTGNGILVSKNVGSDGFSSLNTLAITDGTGSISNYTLVGGAVNITPAQLVVLNTQALDKVYDGTTAATLVNATLSGVLAGDSVTLGNDTMGTFDNKNVGNNKPVTTAMTTSGADAGNYTLIQPTGLMADITQATITVTALGQNKVYDGNATASVLLSSAGVKAGDSISFSDTSALFGSRNVGNGITIAVLGIAAQGADASNYLLANNVATTSADITPAPIILTGARIYDATASANANLFAPGGTIAGVNGETLELTGAGVLASKNVGTEGFSSLGTLALGDNGLGLASNYQLIGNNVIISPAQLLVLGTAANSRVYNGTNIATLTGAALSGVLGGDSVSLINDTTGTFADKNVGNGKAVTTSMGVSGADAGNYILTQPSGLTANITPLAIIVNATGTNKIYDGNTTDVVSLASAGVLAGDNLTFADTSANFSDKNVGTGKTVTVNGITGSGTDLGNYTFNNSAMTTANITPLAIIVSATGTNKVYDGNTADVVSLTGSGILAGDTVNFADASANFDNANAGIGKTVTVNGITGSGADAGNYVFNTSATTMADITQRILNLSGSRVYDGTTNALYSDIGGGTVAGINGDVLTLSGTGVLASPNVGTQGFSSLGTLALNNHGTALAGNYTLVGGIDQMTISAKVLNLIGTRVYDGTALANASLFGDGGQLTGVNGEMLTLTGTGTLNSKNVSVIDPIIDVSGFTLTGNGGALASNYTLGGGIDLVAIRPLVITIDATGQNKVYDGTTSDTATLSTNGVIAGDSVTFSLSGANFDDPNAGLDKRVVVSGIIGSGADASNYTYNRTALTTADITPAVLNLIGARVYDGTTKANASIIGDGGQIEGVNGETLRLLGNGTLVSKNVNAAQAFSSISGYSLLGLGSARASNYTLVGGTDYVTITPATLTVIGTMATNRVYDGTTIDALTGATLSGLFGSDAVTLGNAGTGTFGDKNVGNGKAVSTAMTVSGADVGNYIFQQPSGLTADVTPLAITVNAIGTDKVYDGTTFDTVSLNSAGVLAGDDLHFSNGSASFADKNVGTAKAVTVSGITGSGADAGNYTFNIAATTTADITPLGITVDASALNKLYDGNALATVTLRSNGVLAGDTVAFDSTSALFSDPAVGNGKTVTVSGITDNGADAGNYMLLNTVAITTADITAPPPPPVIPILPDPGFDGAIAQAQSMLSDPQSVDTPYGLAPSDAVGNYSGNQKLQRHSVEDNTEHSDFRSGIALKVVNGGVRLPPDAPL